MARDRQSRDGRHGQRHRLRLALASLALLLPSSSSAEMVGDCPIEMAIGETLGPPQSTEMIVSVTPYDASALGSGLRVCWAAAAGKDNLGMPFQTAPAGVTCEAADTSWTANERVDLTIGSGDALTANTKYWYKVQCDEADAKNPGNFWTSRPVYTFTTLPAAGSDPVAFTVIADSHYGAEWHRGGQEQGATCGSWEVSGLLTDGGLKNNYFTMGKVARERTHFNLDLGDLYMGDSSANSILCGRSQVTDPPDGPEADEYFELWDQIHGWPGKTQSGTYGQGTQISATDANVRMRTEMKIWRVHHDWQGIYAFSPFVFVWGNHDNPRDLVKNTAGDCAAFVDDNQAPPKNRQDHMVEAWNTMVVNPNSIYPNSETACDDPVAVGNCNQEGIYYTFTAGPAQFWVISPFLGSGGGGTTSNVPWDLSGQFTELPSDWSLGQIQYQWLASTMAASSAKWKIIATHHPAGGILNDRKDDLGVVEIGCQHYGRGSLLAVTGRKCDIDGDTVGEGKDCEGDDSIPRGFDESEDTRPAGWKAIYGWCPDGKRCRPTPFEARTNAFTGNASFGEPAIHTTAKANIDSGGAILIFQGHDHTTAGGCKFDSDGCSDVWHITGGQPVGSDGDGEPQPIWAQDGLFEQYHDFNGDTVPDYRTDGSPFPTPIDSASWSIRRAGSQQRGYFRTTITTQGVKVAYVSADLSDWPAFVDDEVVVWNIGQRATKQTDFDGSNCDDSQSKNTAPATCGIAGFDPDSTGTVLEGTQSGAYIGTATSPAQAFAGDSEWTGSGFFQMDFLVRPINTVTPTNTVLNGIRMRDGGTFSGSLRYRAPVAGGQVFLAPYADDGTSDAECGSPLVSGRTYMIRFTGTVATDTWTLDVDQCDANDLDCDGKHDSAGTPLFVPTWGTGDFCSVTSVGTAPGGTDIDGYQYRFTQEFQHIVDAVGICSFATGDFKCGDNFE